MKWGAWLVISLTSLYTLSMLGYEFWALSNKVSGDTISEMVWAAVHNRPWLSALLCISLLSAVGLLCGHFFWQARS